MFVHAQNSNKLQDMYTIENLTYSLDSGLRKYMVEVFDNEAQTSLIVSLPTGRYDRSTIVNALIRSKYSQDQVEAIINNHFLAIGEWIDSKLSGDSNNPFEDPAYADLQSWRAESKRLADIIISMID